MGGIWQVQANFSKGELDPTLAGRVDLAAYYQGVKTATNVRALPQGGLRKRSGLEFLGQALGTGRLENFSFNIEQQYLFVFTNLRLQIYKDGVILDPIDGGTEDFIVTPWTVSQLVDIDFIQSADTVIITHPDIAPQIIQRVTESSWTIGAISLANIPQFNFADGSSPTPTDQIQRMVFSSVNNGDRFRLSLNGILTDDIAYSASDVTTTENNIAQALQDLPITASSGVTVAHISGSTFDVTFGGVSADDFDAMVATPVNTVSTSFAVAITITQAGVSPKEDVWSVARGWPITCSFHESRLWFGGSRSRPSTLWGSRINLPFDFKAGRARDDEAIEATLLTDQVNAIEGLVSNRALQIFTSGAEFYIPESPVTPANISVKPQTNLGSKRVRPVVLEGTTLYIQRTGRALYQFQFINEFQANESRSVSVLSPHLILDPTQMAVSRGSSETDANYVYLVSDNGDLTVLNSNVAEGVQAFTRFTTTGEIVSASVVDDILHVLVKRTVQAVDVHYVERETLGTNTDSSVKTTVGGSNTLTGLDHLEGETVKVKADGAVQSDEVVSSGQITIGRTAQVIEAGLDYAPVIETQPLNLTLPDGPNAAQKKRIVRCATHVFESNGVLVNGERIADKTLGLNQFAPPEPFTGFRRIFLHGWSLEATVTVTQDEPMDMTILALDLEIKV